MSYYNTRQTFFILSSTIKVEETEKIDKFLTLLDKSGVCDLLKKQMIHDDKNKGGRPGYNVYNMLAAIIYSFSFNKASLRNIEDLCIYDLRLIYIMENETPTYKTIGNFINEYIVPNRDKIFSLITNAIFRECNLKMDKDYIDGSKFEADANKYKFVWKPTTFHLKISEKIRILLRDYNLLRGVPSEGIIDSKIVANKLVELANIIKKYDLSLKANKPHKDAYDNRSSQVEGAFGVIKQDFLYERFRRTLLPKVSTEFMLVCLGYNIRKLFKFYSGKAKFEYWKAPVGLQPEIFKKPSAKRLSNKANKIKNKSLNEKAKSKYMYK